MATQIKGMDNVLRNLNKEIEKIEKFSMKGLIRAAIIIRRDMDKTSPLIPIDEGNLRASWFTITNNASIKAGASPSFKGKSAAEMAGQHSSVLGTSASKFGGGSRLRTAGVVLGFTANYAWYVHEMVGANFERPGAGAKFFEASLKRNQNKILKVIRDEAKIK